jgi:hypothetical protein
LSLKHSVAKQTVKKKEIGLHHPTVSGWREPVQTGPVIQISAFAPQIVWISLGNALGLSGQTHHSCGLPEAAC